MSQISPDEGPDCADKCKSTQHGDIITAAISRGSVSDEELCSYLNYICTRCESVKDSVGRSALHVASSCGRINLVRWLIQNRHANINIKDDESGFTPLHRSIFYGKIGVAVELMKLGANTTILDSNNLTMLEHAMKDGSFPERDRNDGELYVWGSNSSNVLGPQQARTTPELHDSFHKKYPNEFVSQVFVDKFHSLIVSSNGKVYTCGHGQGGRLGLGSQQTAVAPELVKFPEKDDSICTSAAIARDHSIFLLSDGSVYTCGLNTHKVLGVNPAPQQSLNPSLVRKFPHEIRGVACGQYHSVVWGAKSIHTWGLNAGQLGHASRTDDKYVRSPKTVNLLNLNDTAIVALSSSDGAIALCTEKGDIYVLHEYQCRKIASRQLNVMDVSIFGGKLDPLASKDLSQGAIRELFVVALTNTGNVSLWRESDPQLCRCVFSINRAIIVRQVLVNLNGLLFVSKDGEAFQGTIRGRKKKTVEKSDFHKFLDRDDCVYVKITKVPRVHRAIRIIGDFKCADLCVIQAPPYKRFEAPPLTESDHANRLESLLQSGNDGDVLLIVGAKSYAAHRFIIASRSTYFAKILGSCDDPVRLDCDPGVFEAFLRFTYTGVDENTPRIRQEMIQKFGCAPKRSKAIRFDRLALPLFYDVTIRCSDGREVQAHRCILSVQTDYFSSLFSMRWGGGDTSTITLPCPEIIAEGLLDFLYTDSLDSWCNKEQDNLLKLMILADQLFITRLKELCEFHLYNYITLKNCVQFLNLAHIYNGRNLKETSLKFIVVNIAPLLELRCFDDLDYDLLKELSDSYRHEKNEIFCRRFITPYSIAPPEEIIKSIATSYPIDLEQISIVSAGGKSAQKRRSRTHKSSENSKIPSPGSPKKDDLIDNIIQFPDSPQENDFLTTSIRNRLKSIKLAEVAIVNDDFSDNFVKLRCNRDDLSTSHEHFPILNSPPTNFHQKSPHGNHFNKSKMMKMSQKQRKRLSSENSDSVLVPVPNQETPRNPWKILTNLPDPLTPSPLLESISDIMSSEKKQKENLVKIKSKLLIYTQMEDKAIDDLRRFYNVDDIMEEIITVSRVNLGAIAVPVWVPGVKKME